MDEEEVRDNSGNVITFLNVDGRWFPRTFEKETVRNIRNVSVRPDDIFLCGYPRSGHHWLYEIIRMLLSGDPQYSSRELEKSVLELEPDLSLRNLASPRIIVTHVLPEDMPSDYFRCIPKTVYVMRDPRDVAVSWYHFYQGYRGDGYRGTWDDWLHLFLKDNWMWGTWHDHIRSFEKLVQESTREDNIHLVFYEDMKLDALQEVRRLDQFMNTGRPDEFLEKVTEMCSFRNMKAANDTVKAKVNEKVKDKDKDNIMDKVKDEVKVKDKDETAGIEDKVKEEAPHYQGDLHPFQYRKGVVGDWKHFFTTEQKTKFDQVYRKRMAGSAHAHCYAGEDRHG